MTLKDLYEALKALPGYDNLVLEAYRISQEVYDPGNPQQVYYYLTGPDSFYMYMTIIDDGRETTLEAYRSEVEGA